MAIRFRHRSSTERRPTTTDLSFSASGAPRLSTWQLPVEQEQVSAARCPLFPYHKKHDHLPLPAGKAALYYAGEYWAPPTFPLWQPEPPPP